jgi:hypothetical protein
VVERRHYAIRIKREVVGLELVTSEQVEPQAGTLASPAKQKLLPPLGFISHFHSSEQNYANVLAQRPFQCV